ncbi:hypothetical protein O181_073351 [Austropuccinia psidii MF-1]|uniref:Uncharacterized protein n=1 Tax=Austropuccinia psidii MF-1 TaxID=1389203 RepID=A0A9Q3I874_9BASI|nr:hypothetical protein [Austropuccinia psidii MF-1]
MAEGASNHKKADTNELVDSKTLKQAEGIGVFDEQGNERPFGGLVRHGTVCVVFIRHFGCSFCQSYIAGLKKILTQDNLGDRKLLVVGCGHWSVIKAYKELLDCPFPIYSDNTRKLFDALSMIANLGFGDSKTQGHYITESLPSAILTSVVNTFKMGTKTFFQAGKMDQLGGEFIFQKGQCVFAHRMRTTRDHTEPEDLKERLLEI